MLYMGTDYHKRYSQVTVIDEQGAVGWEGPAANTPEDISGALSHDAAPRGGWFKAWRERRSRERLMVNKKR